MAVKSEKTKEKSTDKKRKNGQSFLNCILILLFVVFAVCGVLFWMAKTDENSGKYLSEPSIDMYSKLVLALATTNEVNLTSEEINGALISEVNSNKKNACNNISINGIYIDIIKETDLAKFYVPITYKNIRFGISGDLDLHLNSDTSKIDVRIYDTKIGKLPISPKIVAKMIANGFPENITFNDSTISFDSKIKFDFAGETVTLELKECEIKNGNLVVKTKGAVEIVGDFIKDKLSSLI